MYGSGKVRQAMIVVAATAVRCLPKQATLSNVYEREEREKNSPFCVVGNQRVCGHCFAQGSSSFHTVVTDCLPPTNLRTW